jgi:hypothetical protein
LNTTREEGDGSKLSSLSSLEHHHKRKQWHICHRLLFLCNTISKEDDGSSSSQNIEKTKHTRKQQKKIPREGKELIFKFSVCRLILVSHFCPFASALLFQALSLGIFFFTSKRKENTNK